MTNYMVESGNRVYFVNATVLRDALINYNPVTLSGDSTDWTSFSSVGNILTSTTLENDQNMIMKLFPETNNVITVDEIVSTIEDLLFSAEGEGYLEKAEEYVGSLINMEITHFLTIVYIMKTRTLSIDDLEKLLGSTQKSRNIELLRMLESELDKSDFSLSKVLSSMESVLSSVLFVSGSSYINPDVEPVLPLTIKEYGTPLANGAFKGFVRSMATLLDDVRFKKVLTVVEKIEGSITSNPYAAGSFLKRDVNSYRRIRNGPMRLDGVYDYGTSADLYIIGMKYNIKKDDLSTSNFLKSRRVDGYVDDYLNGVILNYSLDQMRTNKEINKNNYMGGIVGERRKEFILSTGRKSLINNVIGGQDDNPDFSIEKAIRLLYEDPIKVKDLNFEDLMDYALTKSNTLEKFKGNNTRGNFSRYALTPYLKSLTLYSEDKNPGSVLVRSSSDILLGFGLSPEKGSDEDKIIEKNLFPKDTVYFGPTRIPRMIYNTEEASKLTVGKVLSKSWNAVKSFSDKVTSSAYEAIFGRPSNPFSMIGDFTKNNETVFEDINDFISAHKKYSVITESTNERSSKAINLTDFTIENLKFHLVYRNTSPTTSSYRVNSVDANVIKRENLYHKIKMMIRKSALPDSALQSSLTKEDLISFGRTGNPEDLDPVNIRKFLTDLRNVIVCYSYDGVLESENFYTGKTLMQMQMELFIIKFLSISFLDYVLDDSIPNTENPYRHINRNIPFTFSEDNPTYTLSNGIYNPAYNGELRSYEVVMFIKSFFSNFSVLREIIENDEILETTRSLLRSIGSMNLTSIVDLMLGNGSLALDEITPAPGRTMIL